MTDPQGQAAGSPPADEKDVALTAESSAATQDVTPDSSPEALDSEAQQPEPQPEKSLTDVALEAAKAATEEPTHDKSSQTDGDDADKADKAKTDDADKAKADDADKDKADDAEADDKDKDVPDEQLPFGKHPRFKQVLDERRQYKERAQELEPKAAEFDKITTFMERSGLSNADVADGLRVMALIQSNPAKAREELQGLVEKLDGVIGNNIPDDLQAAVDRGEVSEDHAREISRLRAEKTRTQQRAETNEHQLERQRHEAAMTRHVEAVRGAVQQWEQSLIASDPDYPAIQQWVLKEIRLRAQSSPPKTPEEAVELAKQAYADTRASLRKLQPERPERKPEGVETRSGSSSAAKPEPKSLLDAVRQAANES